MRLALVPLLLLLAQPAGAELVIANRSLPARSVVMLSDVELAKGDIAGYATALAQVVGQELTSAVYAGRPIALSQLAAPAIIERNQIVTLVFQRSGVSIETEARAMERGGIGARIRVMNLASRNTVIGTISEDGRIHVGDSR